MTILAQLEAKVTENSKVLSGKSYKLLCWQILLAYIDKYRVMHNKRLKLKNSPLIKNPQFSSDLADIQAKLPTLELVILPKFHKDSKKLLIFCKHRNFWFLPFFIHHPLHCHFSNISIKITVHLRILDY